VSDTYQQTRTTNNMSYGGYGVPRGNRFENGGPEGGFRGREEKPRDDNPPHSRLFVIGGKTLSEQDFKEAFEPFGNVEYVSVKRDKGISYVKFSKTSEAAECMEEMNGKSIGEDPRPLKIVIASSRSAGGNSREDVQPLRLFLKIPKSYDEQKLREQFEDYGPLEYVSIVKDKQTNENRGLGYVKYFRFSHAAKAMEECDSNFKPKFAEPRPSNHLGGNDHRDDSGYQGRGPRSGMSGGGPQFDTYMDNPSNTRKLTIMANPVLSQEKLWKLFDVVPGLEFVELNQQLDPSGERALGTVVYNSPKSAAFAIEKLHGFDYPLGSRIMIKFDDSPMEFNSGGRGGLGGNSHNMNMSGYMDGNTSDGGNNNNMPNDIKNLVNTIQHATQKLQSIGYSCPTNMSSGSFKVIESALDPSMCSATLPEPKPLAPSGSPGAKRLFFVCKDFGECPPPHIITDVFSRFGNLIEAYVMRNKNCGYAKYADENSADRAINTLHEANLMGGYLKVMVADESGATKKN